MIFLLKIPFQHTLNQLTLVTKKLVNGIGKKINFGDQNVDYDADSQSILINLKPDYFLSKVSEGSSPDALAIEMAFVRFLAPSLW